jgi:hypothetical protein
MRDVTHPIYRVSRVTQLVTGFDDRSLMVDGREGRAMRGYSFGRPLGFAVIATMQLVMASSSAGMDCYASCRGIWGYGSDKSTNYNGCVSSCQTTERLSENARRFGAIAYSEATGFYGWDFAQAQSDAESRAVAQCRRTAESKGARANDCDAEDRWFASPWCGSIARSSSGSYAVRTGADGNTANSNAMAACRENGGTDCAIVGEMPKCAR